jgi:hypothetical protein
MQVKVPDVNKLSKQFTQMQKMLKKMQGGSQAKMMRQLQSMQGQLPPGGTPELAKCPAWKTCSANKPHGGRKLPFNFIIHNKCCVLSH